jgi:hypothetical protein
MFVNWKYLLSHFLSSTVLERCLEDSFCTVGTDVFSCSCAVAIFVEQSQIDIVVSEAHFKELVKILDKFFVSDGVLLDARLVYLPRGLGILIGFRDQINVGVRDTVGAYLDLRYLFVTSLFYHGKVEGFIPVSQLERVFLLDILS